ncbi:hypothetical protein [Luteimonas changyuni]|uniref:hypothetical protein n=1 Tax=Luteimonas sp. MJ145 TaxID=3129234 RepID=UPI0031BBBA69
MPILPVNPLHTALAKGPGPLPGAHNLSWLTSHTGVHGGHGGGFPLGPGSDPGGGAGRALPGWSSGGPGHAGRGTPGHPGQGIPGAGHPGQGISGPGHPGQGIPGPVQHGHPGQGAPGPVQHGHPGQGVPGPMQHGHPGQGLPGPGHYGNPGQGLVREVLGLPQQLLGQPPPHAGPPPGHVPGQAGAQAAPAAAGPANPFAQGVNVAQAAPGAMHGAMAMVTATHAAASTAQFQLPLPQHAQLAMAPARAEPAHQAVPLAHAAAPAARAEPAVPAQQRAEIAPPRADGPVNDRAAMPPRAIAAATTLAASTLPAAASATTAATAPATSTAALAAGSTAVVAPAAPAATQAQAAEARSGNPLVAADRGQVIARTDIAGTYTGEGPHRRGLRRAVHALPGGLSTLLMALGAQGSTAASNRDAAAVERELRESMMQWLFWLLAIIAYGCVAFAIVALLPVGTGAVGDTSARNSTGGFALLGLLSAAVAWLVARRLASRRQD